MQLSLIVPTYNEKENILPLVERVHHSLSSIDYELIIVDDGSPDGTAQEVKRLSPTYPLRLIERKERGLASAVVRGFEEAQGEALGVIDADLQHPPEMIPQLLAEIDKGADVAIASRYVAGGGVEDWAASRKIISKGATLIAHLSLPSLRKVKDPLSGFFLFRKKIVEGINLEPRGYKILLEVLARSKVQGVAEVPYTFTKRERGKSKISLKEEIDYLRQVVALALSEDLWRKAIKFGLVGISGIGVNEGLLFLLTDTVGLSEYISPIPSIEASIITNFMLNDYWTFSDRREGSWLRRLAKFNLTMAAGAGITYGVYSLIISLTSIPYLIAMLLGIVVGFVWNFTLSFIWTWRKRPIRKDV
jgi:dolichol-phosphate mannosyltransferase